MKIMFSVMAILCTVFGISTFAAAEEAPIRISDELIKQSTDAATKAERQLFQLRAAGAATAEASSAEAQAVGSAAGYEAAAAPSAGTADRLSEG